ncbi:MAG TPA: effector-associated domain EAD1-containing protein [Luteitalea sp.]|nr:effector-associated domain EAD1-containing protein [Luteitalea sp.]
MSTPLTPLQRDELVAALVDAFPTLTKLDQMLALKVRQHRPSITPDGPLDDVVLRIVLRAERDFWTRNLIAGARAATPGNPLLQEFLAAHPTLDPGTVTAAVDHYSAKFLVGGRVFLCRPGFRSALREIGEGLSSRVLVVYGDRGTGKTYSKDFVGYLLQFDPVRRAERYKFAYVDVDQQDATLENLARRIATALGMDPTTIPSRPASDKEQDSRWLPDLYQWLSDGINAGAYEVWWLVLDGFRVSLPNEALDLIQMLGEFADVGTDRLRLVLLNYPRVDALLYSHVEAITAPPITRSDIEAFLTEVFSRAGDPPDPAVVTAAADSIDQQVDRQVAQLLATHAISSPVEPHVRLKHLNVALSRTAQKLLSGART